MLILLTNALGFGSILSLLFGSILSLSGKGRVVTTTTKTNIKSLLFIKSLIYFLLLCDQVEGNSISLTNLNLLTIPNMSISSQASNLTGRVLNPPPSAAQQAAANGGPPPDGFLGIGIRTNNGVYSHVLPNGCTRPFVGAATAGSTLTVNGRVIPTRATKKIKSDSGVRFPKSYHKTLLTKPNLIS